MFRIGIGNDTHRLVAGRPLMLGGVHVPFERGGEGHSDADALLHAISDAILGALSEGDLGVHFPDDEPRWKDSNSSQLLSQVVAMAHRRGKHIVNLDSTILIQEPKMRPYVQFMRQNIAGIMEVELGCVSVKAKTGEGLDAVGQGLAVSALAIVLLGS